MKAVILCGGLGERLRPKTETVPKVMLEVKGKPILQYSIENCKSAGLSEIVLLCGYRHEVIEKYFGDGKRMGLSISYSIEKEKLGTGGAVKNAQKLINDDFLLINGDNFTNFPLSDLLAAFKESDASIMALVRPKNPYGVANLKNIRGNIAEIESFVEKPAMSEWINAGMTALKKETITLFPEKGDVERTVYQVLQKQSKLLGYMIGEKYIWKGIDTVKDFNEISQML